MGFVEELFAMDDKVVVITGGGGVIAGNMAEVLLKAGATVALWGRGKNTPMDQAVKAVQDTTGITDRVFGFTVDTGDAGQVEQALKDTETKCGVPDVLVNGVGGNIGKAAFVDQDMDTFQKVLNMNLVAGFMIPTQVFARYWIEKNHPANVINMTSMSSYIPLSGVWAYDAAKSAVLNLTMAAAKEFAPHGIRVNAIAPGFFLGHQNKALLVKNEATGELTDRGQSVIDHTPFGRFGKQDDLWGATLFLASDRASGFVTGVSIPVDGGYLVDNI
jgi:NAD(P)-dependent dehydrogenase (short-subunit alcohol dehydrogenase family)